MRGLAVLAGVTALAGGALGLLVVDAGPVGATAVSDEAGFRLAWVDLAETQIDLTANIMLTCPGGVAVRNSATGLTLDGHGFTITQTCAGHGVLRQDGNGVLTFQNVTITGGNATGGAFGGGIASMNRGAVTLTNATSPTTAPTPAAAASPCLCKGPAPPDP
ncbi:MAG: pectate lyase-like adhesive domain-containing protein [Actinomycetota bacterium]